MTWTPNLYPDDNVIKAVEGREGGLLFIASKMDGTESARYTLDAAGTREGMSAADGKLFVSLKDGSAICYGKPRQVRQEYA